MNNPNDFINRNYNKMTIDEMVQATGMNENDIIRHASRRATRMMMLDRRAIQKLYEHKTRQKSTV